MNLDRILVVDDDLLIGTLIRRALRPHHVHIENDSHRAMDRLLRGERFDAVLCDVHMPGLDGMEFRQMLSMVAPETLPGFIFMTGGALSRSEEHALASLSGEVIHKPFSLDQLRRVVRDAARRTRTSPLRGPP